MARRRDIKPGFFINEDLGSLDPLTRLFFIGLWTVADRDGKLLDQPRRLRAKLLPYDQADGEAMIAALAGLGFVDRYQANGLAIIQVRNFSEHQNLHPKELPSALPNSDGTMPSACPGIDQPRKVEGRRGNKKDKDDLQNEDHSSGSALPEFCPPLPPSLDTEAVREALRDWDVYKRKRGEKYRSDHGWKMLINEFEPLGAEAFLKAKNSAQKNNYSGIFPVKDAVQRKTPSDTTRETLLAALNAPEAE